MIFIIFYDFLFSSFELQPSHDKQVEETAQALLEMVISLAAEVFLILQVDQQGYFIYNLHQRCWYSPCLVIVDEIYKFLWFKDELKVEFHEFIHLVRPLWCLEVFNIVAVSMKASFFRVVCKGNIFADGRQELVWDKPKSIFEHLLVCKRLGQVSDQ